MKDFQKTDWKIYNKPPYYQQWLCTDDTLKLAAFGGRGLAEIDDHILSLKDRWDLDNASGRFLDLVGKVLSEARRGNTDDYYRILLNLRRLLNTNDGSIPDIIKAIKYLYSSEVVHIVPNYPAGLIIEHEGEGTTGLNFNRILAEIIPAGVGFSTKELFYFSENLLMNEFTKIVVYKNDIDAFNDKSYFLYRNGRILRGGTVLDTELHNIYRGGTVVRDGTLKRGANRVPVTGRVRLPPRRGGGSRDELTLICKNDFADTMSARHYRNGTLKRDGTIRRSGPIKDIFNVGVKNNFVDTMPLDDAFDAGVRVYYLRNGRYKRDGSIRRKKMDFIPLE